ncbi:alpha/beta hydrolase [Enterobacteriaceae bacterium BIT-l23]|uniref:Alpha/beta hydrolase n=1 Tax=Jejubacter calystegiae TaxID=2579935 RepID=A0A4P8YU11_9ENTR|nr:alpha/beta hydrolase-fold protein [Jejubacter calystegiae]NUU68834.1 alpha/beta hydrolase [Enterobacteriaceae bacterium BIT-l23]QCT22432.1 alpha/beta hydrolase [Jejubacter calystegiae]
MILDTKDFEHHGHRYRLYIAYKEQVTEPELFHPLYFLDPSMQFDVMIQNNNESDGAAILYVGIGYPEGVDVQAARTRDYTIPAEGAEYEGGGGAEAFYDFIATQVKPWVESAYAIDTGKQTLAGHSYGGHFVLYTLFNHGNAFQNYVSASPSIWWGDGILVPEGDLVLDKDINLLSLIIGEYEEKVHPENGESDRERIERINADPRLRTRNLAMRLIGNEQRCSFSFLPGRRHGGVPKDYAKIANIIAGQQPQADGL